MNHTPSGLSFLEQLGFLVALVGDELRDVRRITTFYVGFSGLRYDGDVLIKPALWLEARMIQ